MSLAPGDIALQRRNEILELAHRHGAVDVRVFGSRARGEAREASDLDLLVRLEGNRSLLDLVAIKQDLEDLLKVHVDVVTEDSISPWMRTSVLEEAVAL